ncbi:MAG: ABC transporter ATP-binding protein [Mucilaginibacter polytrichastri]|nr:ABC transporter ATP-binding protein [Mucilaginibacter polytrichastri]
MIIELTDIGRRFNRDWIFRKMNYRFESGESYAVLGPNGSGKSTLLSVLSGSLTPSEGEIFYQKNDRKISPEDFYKHISISAPYLDLIEEYTLVEMLAFHQKFKPLLADFTVEKIAAVLNLPSARNKQIRYFSSGMKQRLKLVTALFTDSDILFLDEPTANLDDQGIEWYRGLMQQYAKDRIVIIGSNQLHEYDFCGHRIHLADHKPVPSGR